MYYIIAQIGFPDKTKLYWEKNIFKSSEVKKEKKYVFY